MFLRILILCLFYGLLFADVNCSHHELSGIMKRMSMLSSEQIGPTILPKHLEFVKPKNSSEYYNTKADENSSHGQLNRISDNSNETHGLSSYDQKNSTTFRIINFSEHLKSMNISEINDVSVSLNPEDQNDKSELSVSLNQQNGSSEYLIDIPANSNHYQHNATLDDKVFRSMPGALNYKDFTENATENFMKPFSEEGVTEIDSQKSILAQTNDTLKYDEMNPVVSESERKFDHIRPPRQLFEKTSIDESDAVYESHNISDSNKNNLQTELLLDKELITLSDELQKFYNVENTEITTMESFDFAEDQNIRFQIKELPLVVVTTVKDLNEEKSYSSVLERHDESVSIDNEQLNINLIQSSNADVITPPLPSGITENRPSTIVNTLNDLYTDITLNYDINMSSSRNEASKKPSFDSKSEVGIEPTSTIILDHQTLYQVSSEPIDLDLFPTDNKTLLPEGKNEEYTVFLPKICSNASTMFRLFQLLSTSSSNKQMENMTCDSLKRMAITLSPAVFEEANELLKTEAKSNEIVFIKVRPNSTLVLDTFPVPKYDGVYIPKLVVIIFPATVLGFVIIIMSVIMYRKKCRRNSTSLDLYSIPHLSIKSDFSLTPIPRPSISFPDNNREFLHAYAQDTYNRSRVDEPILNQRQFPAPTAKTYEMVRMNSAPKQEMASFGASLNRKGEYTVSTRSDYASTSHEYGLTNSWDHLKEKEFQKKYGVENPLYRKK